MSRSAKTIIVWMRNDLRLRDHPALWTACQDADYVIPVFIWNESLLNGKHSSSNRNRFLHECLQDLRTNLRKLKGDIVLRRGEASAELLALAAETGAADVYYTIDYSPYARSRDRRVTEALAAHDVTMTAFPGKLALDSFQDVVTGAGKVYQVFTPFWKKWATIKRRPLYDVPAKVPFPSGLAVSDLPPLDDMTQAAELSPDVMPGGETAGYQRLNDFLDTDIQHYHDLHNTLVPKGGTSRLSPYLKFGCVSVRDIEDLLPAGKSPAAFHRQLAWRDFYNYVLFHYPKNATEEFQERYRDMKWDYDEAKLTAWQQGQTGYPIVDAAMRQLLQEGWMHNRARLIVGSFLTKDLGLDWRDGESWFMKYLMDGDEANNNGNWQWIASVGVDPAPAFRRLYNPMTQQGRYDPDGRYVRYYVPELQSVPDKYIARPWEMTDDEQREADCIIGKDYPTPIVDHAAARLVALERYRIAD